MTTARQCVRPTKPRSFIWPMSMRMPRAPAPCLGFWIYLMSDCLIFAMLFAAYGVLGGNYAAGPAPKDLFDLSLVAVNTTMLLLSSITYGFAMMMMAKGTRRRDARLADRDRLVRRGVRRDRTQ